MLLLLGITGVNRGPGFLGDTMWEILIILAFCISFYLARKSLKYDNEDDKDDKSIGPLAALYFSGFWEDKDDAIY